MRLTPRPTPARRLRRSPRVRALAASLTLLAGLALAGTSSPATADVTEQARTLPPGAQAELAAASATRQAVVNAAKAYLNVPYQLRYGWRCDTYEVDCECLNRHAIWDGTYNATGYGLQLNYWLQGQINQGRRTSNPRPGDLIFWDTDPNDGVPYGGDLDHTGVYAGDGWAIDANAYYGYVKWDTTTLNGTQPYPIFVDVLTPNGY